MTVGLISDTHGFWDDRIPTLFAGVDHILHAGDIGDPSILMGLERIAPVTAVMGNCDGPPLDAREIEVIDLAATHRADLAVIARFSENEARP